MKSNRHVSHLGGLGSGDGLSTSLNQDMNPPKISGGGFEGTADASFSKKIGQLRVHIDDEESLMFPENEGEEMHRKKDTIRSKVPFDGKYKIREDKKTKKKLIDLFSDKFFEEEENSNEMKVANFTQEIPDINRTNGFELGNVDYNNKVNSPGYKMSNLIDSEGKPRTLNIEKLNEMIHKEVFSTLKENLEEMGLTLRKKEGKCNECGVMIRESGCGCCDNCGKIKEACGCNESSIEEMTLAGDIAGYTTKLSSPSNMKKHKKNMLPKGYKYY